jgi:hypothetical protein
MCVADSIRIDQFQMIIQSRFCPQNAAIFRFFSQILFMYGKSGAQRDMTLEEIETNWWLVRLW